MMEMISGILAGVVGISFVVAFTISEFKNLSK